MAPTRSGSKATLSALEFAERGLGLLVDPGEGFTLDQVLEDFEFAYPEWQHDPVFLNDYSYALLVRGLPSDLILGGEYAARARHLAQEEGDEELAQAARFNWGVALERLALHHQATLAWQEVLDHEGDISWREETEQHLASLAQWPVARWPTEREVLRRAAARGDVEAIRAALPDFRSALRLMAEDDELKVWAENVDDDSVRADEALAVARTIGEVLKPTDALLADIVAGIDDLAGDARRRSELAEAMRGFFDGLEEYKEFAYESAEPLLSKAGGELSLLGSPLSYRAEFLAIVTADHWGLAQTLDAYDQLLDLTPGSFGVVRAQTLYGRGRAHLTAGYPENSISDLSAAVQVLEDLRDGDLEHSYRSMLGNAFGRAHYRREAEEQEIRWFGGSAQVVHPYYRLFASMAAELRTSSIGAQELLVEITRESLLNAEAAGRVSLLADARTGLFGALAKLGLHDEADEVRAQIEASIAQLEDPKDRWRSEADFLRAEADSHAESSDQRQIGLLKAALDGYEKAAGQSGADGDQFILQRVGILRDLGNVLLGEREFSEAREKAEQAFQLLSRRASSIDEYRLQFASEVRPTVDLRLLASLLDPMSPDQDEDLFSWAERCHHLSAPGDWAEPRALAEIQTEIPIGTSLVQLVALEDHVLALVLQRDSLRQWWLKVPHLERLVDCINPRTDDCAEPWDENAGHFAESGVEPWLCSLPIDERLVLIPGSLARIPFAGLPIQCEGESKKRFVERHVSSLAPSATWWGAAKARAEVLSANGPPTRVLAVGIRSARGFAQNLEHAEAEAIGVASAYLKGGTYLLSEDATQDAIRKAAQQADVLHFATHGLIDPSEAGGSFLALAESRLNVMSLAYQNSHALNSRLAVLSACDTGGSIGGIEGLVGVSRSFLEIGIPAVLSSLSGVNDRYTKDLVLDFYNFYWEAGDGPSSLAKTQRKMASSVAQSNPKRTLRGGVSAPKWSRWALIGGAN